MDIDELPREWRDEADRLDVAVYAAIAATPTPDDGRGSPAALASGRALRLWLGSPRSSPPSAAAAVAPPP